MDEQLGMFLYNGLHLTQQVVDVKSYFEKLLILERFNLIIELGTSFGGLTYILDDITKEYNLDIKIHSLDNSYKDYVDNELKSRGCVYHILDERDEIYKQTVIELISNNGKTLVLCDGGNKKEEFNTYSRFLKSQDIIMAHDYCYNKDIFNNEINNKIWNWFEISFDDIKDSIISCNLQNYEKLDFTNAVWTCYQKK